MAEGRVFLKTGATMLLQSKNLVIGVLLTFCIGGSGVFYFSRLIGIVCLILEITLSYTFVFLDLVLLPLFYAVGIIMTIFAINTHNNTFIKRLHGKTGDNDTSRETAFLTRFCFLQHSMHCFSNQNSNGE